MKKFVPKFFPEYLDQRSTGRAVVLLQLMLKFNGYNRDIVPDGRHGPETARGVMELQKQLGFKGSDVDGNFGPATRRALKTHRGIDIDAIPDDAFSEQTVEVRPEGK